MFRDIFGIFDVSRRWGCFYAVSPVHPSIYGPPTQPKGCDSSYLAVKGSHFSPPFPILLSCDTSRTRLTQSEIAATSKWIHLPHVAPVCSWLHRRVSASDNVTPGSPARTGFHSASLRRLFIVRGFPSKIFIAATMRSPRWHPSAADHRLAGDTGAHVQHKVPLVSSSGTQFSQTVLCFKRMIYCFEVTGWHKVAFSRDNVWAYK